MLELRSESRAEHGVLSLTLLGVVFHVLLYSVTLRDFTKVLFFSQALTVCACVFTGPSSTLPLLFPCGTIKGDTLPKMLKDKGDLKELMASLKMNVLRPRRHT